MASPPPTILITGATGSQGGATARALLLSQDPPVRVHALVRDPTSAASMALRSAGAVLFSGNYDDPAALAAASAGCTGVFINTVPSGGSGGEAELRQAERIVAAAVAARTVTHLVYSSVARGGSRGGSQGDNGEGEGDDDDEDETAHARACAALDPNGFMAGYWAAKTGIEDLVRRQPGLAWTILRPGFLMKNLIPPGSTFLFPELGSRGVWLTAYRPDVKLTLLAEADVGAFAAAAFLRPAAFVGREITLGAQNLTLREIADALAQVIGKRIEIQFREAEEVKRLKAVHPIVESQLFSNKLNCGLDFDDLRKYGIKLTTLQKYLEDRKQDVLKGFTF